MGILRGNDSHRPTCTVEGKQSGEIDHTGARGSNAGDITNINMDIIEKKHKDVHYQMKQRCYNPNHKKYPNYGGRGIIVTERWKGLDGYNNFINDMGYRPTDKHSIDRIDVNGMYEKDNCRWATTKEQSMNRTISSTVSIGDIFGKLTVLKELNPIKRPDGRDRRMFQLQCQCGNVIDGRMDKLNEGRLKSCGQKSCNKYFNK